MVAGPNTRQIDEQRIPVINAHSPSGTSVQNVVHFGQLVNTGRFQAYDYGSVRENLAHYGTAQPPLYNLANMEVPVAFYSSESDYIAAVPDVLNTVNSVKNVISHDIVPHFNHLDFVWGTRAAASVYFPIRDSINKDSTPPTTQPPPTGAPPTGAPPTQAPPPEENPGEEAPPEKLSQVN